MKNIKKKSYGKEILKNISLVIFSILLAIYMIEVAYTFYNISGYKHNKWAKHKRSKYEVYMDHKNSGKDAVVTIHPASYISKINTAWGLQQTSGTGAATNLNEIYPLSGISNKSTILCDEIGHWKIYKSDRYGFNNPDKEWDKLHFDFVLIGDSFAQGVCVHEKDTIAGQLRNKTEVLNLGFAGNGPLLEYATLKEYFKNIEVKNVLWLYYENDLQNLKFELSNKVLINYLEDINFTQDLINRQKEIDYIASDALSKGLKNYQGKKNILFRFEEFNFNKVIFLKSIRHRLSFMFKIDILNINLINLKKDESNYLDEFSEVLAQANNFVIKNNSKLYFVYLPAYPGIYNKVTSSQRLQRYKKVINLVEGLNIPIIDAYKDLFGNHLDPKSLFQLQKASGHYNKEGYRLLVKTILDRI